jgi:hypothetical protein
MPKIAWSCVVLVAFSTTAFAEKPHPGATSTQSSARASITLAQVGIGTPACHIQGTLWRMANNCPPEAVAAARQQHPAEPYWNPRSRRHLSRLQNDRHHSVTASQTAHPN